MIGAADHSGQIILATICCAIIALLIREAWPYD